MQSRGRYRSVLFSVCACLSFPVISSTVAFSGEPAETEPVPVIQASEVIVSATKTPLPVSHVTSAVEVINGEQMQERKLKTVAEALRWAQGLAVFQSGGPGTNVDVRMRGGTPEQTLVLIDGAIMNSATIGSYDFANLTTDNIERIEILRGNQSMLWGSDAMGGVINITTKRGRDKPNIAGFAEYGSFNTIREGANVAGKKGPVDFSGTISRWDTASFSSINYRRGASTIGKDLSVSELTSQKTDGWSSISGGSKGSPILMALPSIRRHSKATLPMSLVGKAKALSMCSPGTICNRLQTGGHKS
jgi:vitamin B12 transporter